MKVKLTPLVTSLKKCGSGNNNVETAGDSTQMNNAKERLSLGPYLRDGHWPMIIRSEKHCAKYRIKIITCTSVLNP